MSFCTIPFYPSRLVYGIDAWRRVSLIHVEQRYREFLMLDLYRRRRVLCATPLLVTTVVTVCIFFPRWCSCRELFSLRWCTTNRRCLHCRTGEIIRRLARYSMQGVHIQCVWLYVIRFVQFAKFMISLRDWFDERVAKEYAALLIFSLPRRRWS